MKYLVYGIYILEFIQSVIFTEYGFWIFVTSFGDIRAIDQVRTAWLSVPVITAIGELFSILRKARAADVLTSRQETTIVHAFYAHRISVLAQSKKVMGAIIVVSDQTFLLHLRSQKLLHCTQLSIVELGGGIAVGVELQQIKYFSLTMAPGRMVPFYTSVGVRTTSQVHFPLS